MTGHDFGVDFKSNLTNGSRNILGAHDNAPQRDFFQNSQKVVIYKKNHSWSFPYTFNFFFFPLPTRGEKKFVNEQKKTSPTNAARTDERIFLIPFPLAYLIFFLFFFPLHGLSNERLRDFFPPPSRVRGREQKTLFHYKAKAQEYCAETDKKDLSPCDFKVRLRSSPVHSPDGPLSVQRKPFYSLSTR